MRDDLTDGTGWGDDCAAFVFMPGFDFWFRYLYEVFCHLVIFFPRFLFRHFGLFSHLLVQTGVLGFYIISRHVGTFFVYFLVRLFHRLDFRVYALCIISCSAAMIGSFCVFTLYQLLRTGARNSITNTVYRSNSSPHTLFFQSTFSPNPRNCRKSQTRGKETKLVIWIHSPVFSRPHPGLQYRMPRHICYTFLRIWTSTI